MCSHVSLGSHLFRGAVVVAILVSPLFPVGAQTYPARTTRIVVPTAPGGGSDTQARLIGKRFTESMGQPFVIDNRPGASGLIGAELVVRAPADGYTILFATSQIV